MRISLIFALAITLLLLGCAASQPQQYGSKITPPQPKPNGTTIYAPLQELANQTQEPGEKTYKLYLNQDFSYNGHLYTFCEYGVYTQEAQKRTVFFCDDGNKYKGVTAAVGARTNIGTGTIFVSELYAADLVAGGERKDSYVVLTISD